MGVEIRGLANREILPTTLNDKMYTILCICILFVSRIQELNLNQRRYRSVADAKGVELLKWGGGELGGGLSNREILPTTNLLVCPRHRISFFESTSSLPPVLMFALT